MRSVRRPRVAAVGLAACVAALLPAVAFAQQTFQSAGAILVPAGGPASTYPGEIAVSGVVGTPESLVVAIELNSPDAEHLDILLVSPAGVSVVLLSDIQGPPSFVGTLRFTTRPGAAAALPPLRAGEYLPSDFVSDFVPDVYPAPAPAPPYASLNAARTGAVNGTWRLYVVDDTPGGSGHALGWSITFNAPAPLPPPAGFTYQGRLDDAGLPFDGPADFRFTLWDFPSQTSPVNQIGGPVLRAGLPVDRGLFTAADLDFGPDAAAGAARWLQIELRAPGTGGAWVGLTPRQPLAPAPVAGTAFSLSRAGAAAFGPAVAVDPQNGRVGVGTANPQASLHVRGTDAFPFRGTLRLDSPSPSVEFRATGTPNGWSVGVEGDGSLEFNALTEGETGGSGSPVASLTRSGFLGLRTVGPPRAPLEIRSDADAGLASDGILLLGNVSAANLVLDANEIQARSGSAASALLLNAEGGPVGIGTPAPSATFRLDVAGQVRCTNLVETSTGSLKHDIRPLHGALDRLLALRGVSFVWNDGVPGVGGQRDLGFVAEQAAAAVPELVSLAADGTPEGVRYAKVTALAVEAVREQQVQIDALRAQLSAKDDELARLRAALERIESRLNDAPAPERR